MQWLYFPFFDHHIAISSATVEELRSCSHGHPITRGVWVRPLGVELKTFSPKRRSLRAREELLARFQRARGCHLLIYVGRLAPEKNLHLLLETMQRLRSEPEDFWLLMVGDGIQRTALERTVRRGLHGRVEFLGYIKDRNVLADLLANCDVFLHSNPNEPFGIAPLEAMASGLPLVAPNSGGILEFASGSNAFVVEPTAKAFSAAVLEAIRNPELRALKVANALSTAASFSLEGAADSFLSLYEQIQAVTAGRLSLDEAAPLFRSQPPGSLGSALTKMTATFCSKGFRAYVNLRTKLLNPRTAGSENAV
jgi:glycosyltransferase involved in cell wall biosynthesis